MCFQAGHADYDCAVGEFDHGSAHFAVDCEYDVGDDVLMRMMMMMMLLLMMMMVLIMMVMAGTASF